MRLSIIILFIFQTNLIFSQVTSHLVNKETKEPVPFASIYIKNQQKGTSSNSNGRFEIEINSTDSLIISSVGYKSMELSASEVVDTIFLIPDIAEMELVEVENKKKIGLFPERNTIGDVSRSIFNSHWMASSGYPYEIARFFEFDEDFSGTRFVESVTVKTTSDINEAVFAVKFYKLGEDGLPRDIINKNPVIGKAKKGKHKTKIELEEVVYFPKEGLFVAVEFLILDENKTERDRPINFGGNTYKFKYEPSFSVTDLDKNNYYSLDIKNQKWTKFNVNRKSLECEIVLTE